MTRILKERGYSRIVDKLVFLGTPHREDYKTARGTLKQEGKVINVYDNKDGVQIRGGYNNLIPYPGIGEGGDAKRTIPWAINIKVDSLRKENKPWYTNVPWHIDLFESHSKMASKDVLKQICEKTNTCKKK